MPFLPLIATVKVGFSLSLLYNIRWWVCVYIYIYIYKSRKEKSEAKFHISTPSQIHLLTHRLSYSRITTCNSLLLLSVPMVVNNWKRKPRYITLKRKKKYYGNKFYQWRSKRRPRVCYHSSSYLWKIKCQLHFSSCHRWS